ncbi:hypothetical protein PHYSODRAFT_339506 [Phytophthora sojae]|uniref:Uncharacterized protein n=1 Tax=Phytophthora sojae (strain P6497) TaxID=1094619 RepID=G5A719_PHYSP|nr:hypothetical protein PHYSODRAFT_339506 [Phytophthora sojae]EGZ09124.1 hypothetical protein PHYSODRAFT_339506 [Phytophthora sojae]|eukprot:XP_009535757.1 hypothetical protein PHYSODRAFT_339506 [Phytophthora sojae]
MAPTSSKKRKHARSGERKAGCKVRRITDSGNQATVAIPNDSVVAQGAGDSNATKTRQSSVQIQVFPTALPTQLPLDQDTYAVRPCYVEYYDLITAQLRYGTRTITVSGTSGTGNTMLYGYVFSRFSRENPDAIIITASYTDESRLIRVTVFEGERVIEAEYLGGRRLMKKARALAIERKTKLVYMFDGPPKSPPPPPAQMICFTNPNNEWLDKVEHAAQSFVCYTPLWELDELVATAAHVPWRRPGKPDVFLDRATVEERFATFGGVARECLAGCEKFVTRRKNELVHDIDVTFDQQTSECGITCQIPVRPGGDRSFPREVLAGLSALSDEVADQRDRKLGGGRANDAKKDKLKCSEPRYQPGVFFKLAVWEEYKETFMSGVRDAEENSTDF